MYTPMAEGAQISLGIPNPIKIAIADAVIIFGRIEQELIEIAWMLSSADLKKRLQIARTPTTDNFIAIIEDVERTQPCLNLGALKTTARELANDRNLIVHGAWTMANDKPWVVWHKFAEDPDSVIGEYFEQWRFDRFMIKALCILDMLRNFHDMLERDTGMKTTSIPRGEAK